MRPTHSMIAVLFALGTASALAQTQTSPRPPASKPVDDSASYGPVLNPQAPTASSSTQAGGEASPQAQEERAGQPPTSKPIESDPSARPAPQSAKPQQQENARPARQEGQQQAKKPPQAKRRAVEQRIESTPRIAAPQPRPRVEVESGVAPAPVGPQSTQVLDCVGGACTGANGATYNIPPGGGPGTSSSGRPCTSNGTTIQCL